MTEAWHPQERWSEADRNRVAEMLADGLSAGQISSHFPHRSRQAVVAVVHRDPRLKQIGFSRAPGDNSGCKPMREPGNDGLYSVGRPIDQLGRNQCRYPVNDASGSEVHLFCGRPSRGSWCPHHREIVFAPSARVNTYGVE